MTRTRLIVGMTVWPALVLIAVWPRARQAIEPNIDSDRISAESTRPDAAQSTGQERPSPAIPAANGRADRHREPARGAPVEGHRGTELQTLAPMPSVSGQETQLALLEQQVTLEARDASWASRSEAELGVPFDRRPGSEPPAVALRRANCAASLCELQFELSVAPSDAVNAMREATARIPWPSERFVFVNPQDPPVAKVFVAREGTHLPRLPPPIEDADRDSELSL